MGDPASAFAKGYGSSDDVSRRMFELCDEQGVNDPYNKVGKYALRRRVVKRERDDGLNAARGIVNALKFTAIAAGLAALVMCSGCASNWEREDTVREISFQAVNALDAYQTAQFRGLSNVEEGNPVTVAFIGTEPRSQEVAVYFALLAVSHYLISAALPDSWRPWWQHGTVAFGTAVVVRNCQEFDAC